RPGRRATREMTREPAIRPDEADGPQCREEEAQRLEGRLLEGRYQVPVPVVQDDGKLERLGDQAEEEDARVVREPERLAGTGVRSQRAPQVGRGLHDTGEAGDRQEAARKHVGPSPGAPPAPLADAG